MSTKKRKIELLAPASSVEAFYVAVDHGADAIYLGLKDFSARASAENFDYDSLKSCIKYAHVVGVKVYVALNTVVKDSELDRWYESVDQAYLAGADAVIVADVYLASIVKQHYPDMQVHLSTQAGVNNVEGAVFAKHMGIDRVILARETAIEDVEKIAKVIPTEVFVQGALCSSYSGHCYLSSFVGGNSGNRGRCKQPCRREYSLDGSQANYAISLSDLSIDKHLKRLVKSGIVSLKIEGRLRSTEYVAKALDYYNAKLYGVGEPDLDSLKRTFNRGDYTEGLAFGKTKSILSPKVQGHLGLKIGKVVRVSPTKIYVDGEIPSRGNGYKIIRDGVEVGSASSWDVADTSPYPLSYRGEVRVGDDVHITLDKALDISTPKRKADISVTVFMKVGDCHATVKCGDYKVKAKSAVAPQMALTSPIKGEDIKDCMLKVDEYPFRLVKLRTTVKGDLFMPKSHLNALRRTLYELLYESIGQTNRTSRLKDIPTISLPSVETYPSTALICDSLEGVRLEGVDQVIYSPKDYLDISALDKWLILAGDKEKYIYLPAFVSHKGLAEFGQIVDRFDGIYSDGLVGVSVSTLHRKPLWLAVDSNITNSTSFAIAKRYADRITVSKEITLAEARDMLDAGAYYYTAGSIRVMEFEYCPKGYSCRNCDKGDFTLTDYRDREYKVRRYSLDGCHFEMYYDTPLKVKRHHYNRLLNGLTLSCDEINAMIEGKPFATSTPGHSEIPVQ
ncbi:MAG: U32 family peptidase [Clostridia bacterium]|nr:U32 family peptidase [Clostridia bacterium]